MKKIKVIAVATTALLAVSACSSSTESREAAPVETEMSSGDAEFDGDGAVVGSGGSLGTRICVINKMKRTVDRDYTKIVFTKADSSDSGDFSSNQPRCAEGTDRAPFSYDLRGDIYFRDIPTMKIWGQNPWVGAPGAGVDWMSDKSPDFESTYCVGGQGFDVGRTEIGDNGVQKFTVTRLPDSRWKEFTITIEDSANPTPDGKYRSCSWWGS